MRLHRCYDTKAVATSNSSTLCLSMVFMRAPNRIGTQGASSVAALVTEIPPLVYVHCPVYMYSARVGRTILNICKMKEELKMEGQLRFCFWIHMVEFGILNLPLLAIPYLLLDKGHVLVARCSANEPRANETGWVVYGGVMGGLQPATPKFRLKEFKVWTYDGSG